MIRTVRVDLPRSEATECPEIPAVVSFRRRALAHARGTLLPPCASNAILRTNSAACIPIVLIPPTSSPIRSHRTLPLARASESVTGFLQAAIAPLPPCRTHSNSVILSAGNQFACELIQQSKDLAFSLCHSRIREFSLRMQFCRHTGNFHLCYHRLSLLSSPFMSCK